MKIFTFAVSFLMFANIGYAAVTPTPPCTTAPCMPAPVTWQSDIDTPTQIQYIDSSIVAHWLPESLELAQDTSVPGKHPVVFMLQKNIDGVAYGYRGNTAGLPIPTYNEQAVMIPSVRAKGSLTSRSYLAHLNVADELAVALGREAWAMPKFFADIAVNAAQWTVKSPNGAPILAAAFVPYSPTSALVSVFDFIAANPAFAADLPLFNSNYISVTPAGPVCYEIVLDLLSAQFQSIKGFVNVQESYLPGLQLGAVSTSGFDAANQHSFRVKGKSSIGAAHSCVDLQ